MYLSYLIPDVPLIPQDNSMACWYASAQMLIQWRRRRTRSTEAAFSDPAEAPPAVRLHQANNSLPKNSVVTFAKLLGLQPVPYMTPTDDAICQWLQLYGPIWTAGKYVTANGSFGHAVVITGISPQGLCINDPWPVNVGSKYWKDSGWLTEMLSDISLQVNFLHFPY
jgi:hypothetical protein